MQQQTRKLITWTALFVLFIVAITAYQLIRFADSGQLREVSIFPIDTPDAPYRITMEVTDVDLVNGELTARVDIIPPDSALDDHGQLRENLLFTIESLSGTSQTIYESGSIINPFITTLEIIGKPRNYPLDTYSTYVALRLNGENPDVEVNEKSPRLPFIVAVSSDITGFAIGFSDLIEEFSDRQAELEEEILEAEDEEIEEIAEDGTVTEESTLDVVEIATSEKDLADEKSFVGLLIEVTHSGAVLAFIIFLMFLQWILAFVAFIITLTTVTQKRAVKISNFSWLGALLFAQIALRNAMPGTPKVGTLGDSLSFFWVLGIITLSMLVLVGAWIYRGE